MLASPKPQLILVRLLLLLIFLGLFELTSEPAARAQTQALVTRWAAEVTPENVLPDYPRPQFVRQHWLNLDGRWDYRVMNALTEPPTDYEGQILVPFPIESALSGVQRRVDGKHLWYHRTFNLPEAWTGQRVLLYFGAVDWRSRVWVNGQELGTHSGGYDPFSLDITDALADQAEQELIVYVYDPTEGTQPRGKQVRHPDSIWYTPTSGIWQTVWLEPVPSNHLVNLHIETDIDRSLLILQVDASSDPVNHALRIEVLEEGNVIATMPGRTGSRLEIPIENPRLWSPDAPFLYDLRLVLMQEDDIIDEVSSYFGMRKIAVGPDAQGVPRLWLNNEVLFQFGLLDQGFWPDGLYTAPTDEALRYDIEVTRQLGFNLIRKHVKVEPERWYYWADRLGVLVWQDMPSGDEFVDPGQGEIARSERSAAQFELELQRMIDTHRNHPSIVMWVLFNEGWGQYDTARLTDWIERYDPTRLVNSVSGWNDVGVGVIQDMHAYPGPAAPPPDPDRASVLGEFGGLGLPIPDHTWLDENSWGYREYDDVESLLAAYRAGIRQLQALQQTRGLAAAIYTQTTDVETEVNGMMTYDRAIIKLNPEQIRPINRLLYE